MRVLIFMISSALWLAACGSPPRAAAHPFTGKRPLDSQLDLEGAFTFSPAGELALTLVQPCTVTFKSQDHGVVEHDCDLAHLGAIHVIAVTPWHSEVQGVWTDASHLVFRTDWKQSGLDPLAADAPSVVLRPWAISGTTWTPTAAEADQILKLVGNATETEADLVSGGAAPTLEVTSFEVADGALHAGSESTLVVRIANRGPGTAYRVIATTRSSLVALHGQRLAFGLIKPGADKTRRVRVAIPISETATDTMLVLVLDEGNGFAPHDVSRRLPIAASATVPILTARCSLAGRTGPRLELDAGERIVLHCKVDNAGTSAAKVELETSIGGAAPAVSPAQDITVAGHAEFDVPITVPRELAIDAAVEIAVTARDRASMRAARTKLVGVIRKPGLCKAGQLTRAQYRAKLTELRAAVAAGDLTQAQLDRYDAQLVTCLQ